jgi:peroxiredoxin Q/BCP
MPETLAMPNVGEKAPAIDMPDSQGGHFTLADHLGSWVVVYFYPRANTPG